MPSGVYTRVKPRKSRAFVSNPKTATPKASVSPSVRDLAWAAGFIEGEATINLKRDLARNIASEHIGARQVERECLDRLQAIFGGRVSYVRYNSNSITKAPGLWNWSVYGQRARGVIYTLFSLMSTRRRGQMKIALRSGG